MKWAEEQVLSTASVLQGQFEYLSTELKALTLFATHYHELTDLTAVYPNIKNLATVAKERR